MFFLYCLLHVLWFLVLFGVMIPRDRPNLWGEVHDFMVSFKNICGYVMEISSRKIHGNFTELEAFISRCFVNHKFKISM